MKTSSAQLILGVLIIIGFFGSLIILMWRPGTITEINREPILLMVGCLISAFSLLIGFYFGSSAGSARKTDLLSRSEPIVNLENPA